MTRAASPTLEDIIDELFYSSEEMNAELVQEYVKRYPQYERELLDFAVHWAASCPLDDSCLTENKMSESRLLPLQSEVLNRIYKVEQSSSNESNLDSEMAPVLASIKGAKALRQVSEAIGFGEQRILLSKILNGSISDIPDFVFYKLAEYLHWSADAVRLAVNQPTGLLRAYKSSGKPDVPRKETWKEAVTRLNAAPEEKQRLLAMGNRNAAK